MTQTNIIYARRQEIKETVYKTLCNYQAPFIPLQIKTLARSFSNIRLISYSKHMSKMNISYNKMMQFAGTKDACTDYYTHDDLYIIYYNDIDKNITLSNRYRWNIAHELGHIMLNHHKAHKKTRIFRNELSTSEYKELENEADYFAQLILVPHVVLYAFKITTARQIRDFCKISGPASYNRFRDYKQWIRHINGNDIYDKPLFHYYYNFIYKKQCLTCGAHLIQQKGKYCPICGNKTLQWGDGKMIYKIQYKLNENSRLCQCSVCENENISNVATYCQICGAPVQNKCTSCGKLASADARYCIYCSSKTTFNSKLLQDWRSELDEITSEKNANYVINSFLDLPDEDDELPFN
ncbi:MAG: double zinc ribbon domain-containing protein [Hungatella sp.]